MAGNPPEAKYEVFGAVSKRIKMPLITKIPDTSEKLKILSRDSQYDLACACGTQKNEHRKRSTDDKWIYPVVLPGGGTTYLFKILLSNQCVNDCKYCPLRADADSPRCALSPEELARIFFDYYKSGRVNGLFLSSAVTGSADITMERINRTALILRKMQFRGYIHLKIIPGSSDAAIRQSLSLASAVSLNIEAPGENNFKYLSNSKDYLKDIIRPIRLISRLTAEDYCYRRVKQTTQFVVGASRETDKEIIAYSWKLYKELNLNRIYFSAYQRGTGSPGLPGENSNYTNSQLLTREHRLYQVDWLIRKYGFKADEIPLEQGGNLSLTIDPKEMWANAHPEFFPVDINNADKYRLLRVPGIGEAMAGRILSLRKNKIKIGSLDVLKKISNRNYGFLLNKAGQYLVF